MKTSNSLLSVVLLFFLFSSCNQSKNEINPNDTKLLIENLISKFSTAFNSKDTSMVSEISSDSIQLIYPDKRLTAYGVRPLQNFVSNPLWNYVSIKPKQIVCSNELSYSTSIIRIDKLQKDSPDILKYRGEILMVFKKEEEFWKLAVVSYSLWPDKTKPKAKAKTSKQPTKKN